MLEIIYDNTYPSSHLHIPLDVEDDEGYLWEGTPIIVLNSSQIEEFKNKFNISLEEARDIIISHELGHYTAWLKGYNIEDEELAWELAPRTSISSLKREEIRKYCLSTYKST